MYNTIGNIFSGFRGSPEGPKWHFVFNNESRFYLHRSDACMCNTDLLSDISQNVFTHNTGPSPCIILISLDLPWQDAISYNSHLSLVLMDAMLNNAIYTNKIVQPILLPFLQQEGNVLFHPTYMIPLLLNMPCKIFDLTIFMANSPDHQLCAPLDMHGTRQEDA